MGRLVEITSACLIRTNTLQFDKNDPDTLVGVIARSAGVWDSKWSSHHPSSSSVFLYERLLTIRLRRQNRVLVLWKDSLAGEGRTARSRYAMSHMKCQDREGFFEENEVPLKCRVQW